MVQARNVDPPGPSGRPRTEAQGAIQFEYLAEIAVGTTARVDLCRAKSPPHLAGKLLSVKRLHQHIAEDPAFANQFLDEVWMTAALKHPNVVEVAGWGNDDDGMYLAVELVQGVSLQRLMKTIFDTGEAFTERMVVYIASRLCRGLAAAHSLHAQNGEPLGLVHRDLTPGNVLVGFNGGLKITDFGLAKAKQRLTKTLTGLLKGQPQYMAPEQARGDAIDHRTDLFALGVLMFELFAGRKPWLAASDFDAVQAILSRPADDLRELRPKIDKELASIVHRCLEKDPAARFQSANEIQARLDEWLLVHGYQEGNEEALARFVRRNAMRQMRWFERAVAGELTEGRPEPPKMTPYTGQLPAVSFKGGDEDSEDETDITDAESLVAQMQQRANDPKIARRIYDEAELAEEVPTIVQKAGALPLKPKVGAPPAPAAKITPAAKPASRPPPHMPPKPIGVPGVAGIPRAPAPAAARLQRPPGASAPAPIASAAPGVANARSAEIARSVGLPAMRPMHESIVDEESDARTTAVKSRGAKPMGARVPLIIQTGPREPAPSISDPESEEVPTLPLQGLPPDAARRAAQTVSQHGSRPPAQHAQQQRSPSERAPEQFLAPGKLAPHDPRVPPPPGVPRSLPSLSSMDDEWPQGRGPITEERLFAEADRFALEAVRYSDEAKMAAARAERQAMIAKIAGDAAAIAVEAVRIASTAGFPDAARRLEDSYALEATIRRLAASPLDVSPQVAQAHAARSASPSGAPRSVGSSSPSGAPRGAHSSSPSGAPRMPPAPPSSSPGHSSPPQGREQSSQYPPQMQPPAAHQSSPVHQRPDAASLLPPPPNAMGTGAFDAFESRLRPTIFGLPSLHVAALAIGTFVLVLILMWIILG